MVLMENCHAPASKKGLREEAYIQSPFPIPLLVSLPVNFPSSFDFRFRFSSYFQLQAALALQGRLAQSLDLASIQGIAIIDLTRHRHRHSLLDKSSKDAVRNSSTLHPSRASPSSTLQGIAVIDIPLRHVFGAAFAA